MTTKPWLIKGCRWRIGDGKDVSIWHDHRIPGIKWLNLLANEEHPSGAPNTFLELIDQHRQSGGMGLKYMHYLTNV